MHSGNGVAQLLRAASCQQQPERVFALGLFVERTDDFAEIIDIDVGGLRGPVDLPLGPPLPMPPFSLKREWALFWDGINDWRGDRIARQMHRETAELHERISRWSKKD